MLQMRLSRIFHNSTKAIQKIINNDCGVINEDKYVIRVRAGSGGSGIPRYNGRGGNGGNVYIIARAGMAFEDIKKNLGFPMKVKAEHGSASQKIKLIGDTGKDIYLHVPLGVEAVDETRKMLLARCTRPNKRHIIARGGAGGQPSNNFKGERGEELDIALHLKLLPNVGLVGFPNAGKSTLLKAFVPRKSVKIAPYPFTTVKPQIAFWKAPQTDYNEMDFTLSVADFPGLIEGASRNRGKGYNFLKHLEYSDIIVMVVDCMGFQLSNSLNESFRSPVESVAILNCELENYDTKLTCKPAVLLINKIDIARDPEDPMRLVSLFRETGWEKQVPRELRPQNALRFDYVFPISAKSGDIENVKNALLQLHKELHPFEVPCDDDDEKGSKQFV